MSIALSYILTRTLKLKSFIMASAGKQLMTSISQTMKFLTSGKQYEKILSALVLKEASPGHTKFEFEVEESHLNFSGALYGGYTASVVDFTTSLTALTTEQAKSGVSTDLHVSYLRSAKLGDLITVDARCNKAGNTLVYLEAKLTDQNGKLIATGVHTKCVTGNF